MAGLALFVLVLIYLAIGASIWAYVCANSGKFSTLGQAFREAWYIIILWPFLFKNDEL